MFTLQHLSLRSESEAKSLLNAFTYEMFGTIFLDMILIGLSFVIQKDLCDDHT